MCTGESSGAGVGNGPRERFIREAIALARRARDKGNHPFGALLVRGDEILLRAENTVVSDNDVTRHAELNLVSAASRRFAAETLAECAVYASTEPCAMCTGAIYWAGIGSIVYGCSAQTLGELTGGSLVVPCETILANAKRPVAVRGPVLEEEAKTVHAGFWSRS
ncbi:MAG: nucleoside deaminase [Kiritimatiellae bacterium]|nr:nucleoside deaminase [Kiritimatiellia bacterium]